MRQEAPAEGAIAATPTRVPTARAAAHRRRRIGLVLLALGTAVAAAASVAVGARSIPLDVVVDAVRAYDPTVDDHLIVREMRIPRTILALLVGAALGLSGAVMQALTRNPLADPGLMGLNAGATLGVVGAAFFFGVGATTGGVWFALGGAALAGAAVYAVGSTGRGGATSVKLAIAGAALGALLTSLTSSMLLLDSASLDQYRFWAVGSVAGRDLDLTLALLPFFAIGALLALGATRALDSMALGDDVARSLGQRVGRARAVAALAIVLLCGAATAAAGPIWFVGLIVPHVVRTFTGPAHRWLLPCSMFAGAFLLTASDVLGRVLVRPGELEVGVVTAFVGAPVFIAFVRRRRIAEL